ncbi:hypothetical protein JCM10207_001454 [Rhodosporidiobolus poonsookiae]
MGKREAESQLTQNNWEDDDSGAGEGGSGDFKKASDSAMAGRKIRGMPKRKGAAAAAAPAPAADAAPKPSAFASTFGAPAANPFAALGSTPAAPSANAFSFGAPAAKPATNGAAAHSPAAFSFGSTPSSFSTPAASTSTSTPSTAPTFSFGASTSAFSAPKTAAPAPAAGQSAALKYFSSLRALNLSLVDALTAELDKDPFVDLSAGVFDKIKGKYAEHRSKVQQEYDGKEGSSAAASKPAFGAPTVPASEIPDIFRNPPKPVPIADLTEKKKDDEDDGIPAIFKNPPKPVPIADLSETGTASDIPDIFKNPPKPVPIADLTAETKDAAPAPPAPPATFAFAGSTVKSAPASTPSAPVTGGFVFKADAPADPYAEKSKFSFPPASSSSSSSTSTSDRSSFKPPSAPKLAPAKLTNPPAKPSPLRFGQSVSPPTSPEKAAEQDDAAKKVGSGFSFGATFGKIAKGEKEGEKKEEKKKEEKKDEPKPAFAFGASTTPSTGFSFGSTPTPFAPAAGATSSTPAKPFTFGAPTPFSTPSTASALSKPAASPPIATSFGAASPPTFGFGAALQDKDKSIGTASGAARNTGFAFGSSIGSAGSTPSTGFSFGAPAKDDKNQPAKVMTGFSFAPTASTSSAPAPSSGGFSFAPSASIPAAAASRTADSSIAPSVAETDSAPQTPGANPFSAPGEGEEGETVLHSVRGKVFKLAGGEAEVLGVANVQIKEKEEGGKTKVRMLARNETNGAVLINFNLYPGFSLKVDKVFATFSGFDSEAKPVIYRVRVKTKEMVDELAQEVDKATAKLA